MSNQSQAQQIRAQAAMKSIAIKFLALACAVGTLLPGIAQAPGDVRVALVIGNAAYPGKAALTNPGNDAKAMSETLRGLGFTVVEARDASRAQMVAAISTVRDTLKGRQGIGMLYYAGHGLQVDWRNYMVPVDAQMSKASDVPEQAVDLGQVIEAFKSAGNRMNIVVLDACRDNPFAGTATGKGLAQLDAPPGTFLAYATAPGNVAEDGDTKADANGLYTKFLLQELKKPQAKIEDVFKRVRLNVRQQSQGRQIPWESTSLEDDFYFDRTARSAKASSSDVDATYQLQLITWNAIKMQSQPDMFIEYLKQNPSGYFSELAQFRLDQLSKPTVVAIAKPDDKLSNNSLTTRAALGDKKEWRVKSEEPFSGGRSVNFINQSEVIKIDDQHVTRATKFDGWGKSTTVPSVSDLLGNPISNADIVFADPTQFNPAEFKVGHQWKFVVRRTTEIGKTTMEYVAKIAARETVKVTAGEYETFKIEMRGNRSDGAKEDFTLWQVPSAVGVVKTSRKIFNKGRMVFTNETELISFKTAS